MDYQYIPPVPRVHRVTIDGRLKTYADLWNDRALADHVTAWLAEHAPQAKAEVGAYSPIVEEWQPIAYIDFPAKRLADAFMEMFARPEQVDIEVRTVRAYTESLPALVTEQNGQRLPDHTIITRIVLHDDQAKITLNEDEEGEYLEVLFSQASAARAFERDLFNIHRSHLPKRTSPGVPVKMVDE